MRHLFCDPAYPLIVLAAWEIVGEITKFTGLNVRRLNERAAVARGNATRRVGA